MSTGDHGKEIRCSIEDQPNNITTSKKAWIDPVLLDLEIAANTDSGGFSTFDGTSSLRNPGS